jgi:hypothetical protein
MCLMEVEHLLQNLQNNRMVGHVPLEILQYLWSLCKVSLQRLLPNEQNSSVADV